jgi:hypothetical protein
MRWWYLAASAGVLMVVATIVSSALRPPRRAPGPEPRCAPLVLSAPRGPPATASLVVHAPPGIELEVDGHRWAPGVRLTAGHHRVRASAGALQPFEVTVRVEPFSAVILEAKADGPAVVVALAGARCESCPAGPEPEVDGPPVGSGSLDQSAALLARGDWPAAAQQLRRLGAAERRAPRAQHQLEAVRALRGAPLESPALRELAANLNETETGLRDEWSVAAWNAQTERFYRVLKAFGLDASGLLSQSSERFDALSADFAHATELADGPGQARVLAAALLVEQQLAASLVALHATDCAWAARVQQAFAP